MSAGDLLGRSEYKGMKNRRGSVVKTNSHMEDSTAKRAATGASISEAFGAESSLLTVRRPVVKNELEKTLLEWWRELLLAEQQINADDDFFDLGGDSLVGVQLFNKIRETYGVDLRLSILFDARTVRQLAEVIAQNALTTESEHSPWCTLSPIQPKGSRGPLFWIPGGNGTSVLLFKQVSLLLGGEQPSYGFEAKMPEPDEEFESIPERARRFIVELRSLQPHGPYSLIGFCGGGFIAFEMAQQLSSDGQEVAFLGIVECADDRHPHKLPGKVRMRAERIVWKFKQLFARGARGMTHWAYQHSESAVLRVKRIGAQLLGRQVSPLPEVPVDMYEKARRIVDRYQPVSYRGKSYVFIGEDTYHYCGLSETVDPRLIWCRLSEGGAEVRTVPGDHTDMLEEPLVHKFAEQLKSSLERATAPGS
jgi:thioesterase domain-containing protein/acyl carrier protein